MRLAEIMERAGPQTYIRFGDIPASGRSGIGASTNQFTHARRRGDEELGVSVYPARFDRELQKWILDCNNYATLGELVSRERPAFVVTGDHVIDPDYEAPAYGQDSEPLLTNVRVLRPVTYQEIIAPGWGETSTIDEMV
jgi:hypothetical protein